LVALGAREGGVTTLPPVTYSGSFAGQQIETHRYNTGGGCTFTYVWNGALTMTVEQRSDGTVSGTASMSANKSAIGVTGDSCAIPPDPTITFRDWTSPVTGTTSNIAFNGTRSGAQPSLSESQTLSFSGGLAGGVVSGAMTYSRVLRATSTLGVVTDASGSVTFPVTLR
jgi:hypothetical protein